MAWKRGSGESDCEEERGDEKLASHGLGFVVSLMCWLLMLCFGSCDGRKRMAQTIQANPSYVPPNSDRSVPIKADMIVVCSFSVRSNVKSSRANVRDPDSDTS